MARAPWLPTLPPAGQRSVRKALLDAPETRQAGRTGGFPMVVPVDAVANGQHWFHGSIEPVRRGETLIVELAGLDETHRSELLRWVYREQMRLHRETARIEQKARRLTDRRSDEDR